MTSRRKNSIKCIDLNLNLKLVIEMGVDRVDIIRLLKIKLVIKVIVRYSCYNLMMV